MSFLSSEILHDRIPDENIISNYNSDRLKHAAYELAMGSEAYVTTDEKKKKYSEGDQIVIHPGQFAVLITEEKLQIPSDLIAFISIKFSIKFEGLVNVSGFHVDPDFKGRLKFSVYNAGSRNVVITTGEPTFQIWFSQLQGTNPTAYNGKHNGQMNITANDVMKTQGDIASPNALKRRIDNLEESFKTLRNIGIGIFVGLMVLFFRTCDNTNQQNTPEEVMKENQISPNKADSSFPKEDSL